MSRLTLRSAVPIMAACGLMLTVGAASAQPQNPPQDTPAPMMPCQEQMKQGGMGPGMMMGSQGQGMMGGQMMGGQMMNWQTMHDDMRALHEEVVKLRAEMQKRDKR